MYFIIFSFCFFPFVNRTKQKKIDHWQISKGEKDMISLEFNQRYRDRSYHHRRIRVRMRFFSVLL